MRMTLDKFFKMYGHLLPKDYKRMMRFMYEHSLTVGGEIVVPSPTGEIIHIVK